MGAAYYIVLEKPIEGLDTAMDGKSLLMHMDALDRAAKTLAVRPLSEFFSMPPGELAEFMDGAEDLKLPGLKEFSAAEGLTTVRALLLHSPVQGEYLPEDLRECERILSVAAAHGVGWHFQIDV